MNILGRFKPFTHTWLLSTLKGEVSIRGMIFKCHVDIMVNCIPSVTGYVFLATFLKSGTGWNWFSLNATIPEYQRSKPELPEIPCPTQCFHQSNCLNLLQPCHFCFYSYDYVSVLIGLLYATQCNYCKGLGSWLWKRNLKYQQCFFEY